MSVVGCSHLDRRLFPVSIALQGHDPSEQLGLNTPDLHSAEGDSKIHNQNDHEGRDPGVHQPSVAAPERTSDGGKDGGDTDDLVQSGRPRGMPSCPNCIAICTDHH